MTTDDPKHRPFGKTNDGSVVNLVEFGNPLPSRFAVVSSIGIPINVVRVDVERHKRQRVEARWLDYGHVVGCLDRGASNVRASARPHVDRTVADACTNRFDERLLVQACK